MPATNAIQADPPSFRAEDIIDLARYPLNDRDSATYREVVENARSELAKDGCVRLPGFIQTSQLDRLLHEAEALAPKMMPVKQRITVYGGAVDTTKDPSHPLGRLQTTTNGFVTQDFIPEDTIIRQLYAYEGFSHLVADCLNVDVLYPFADPMRGVVVNVMEPGSTTVWHFDANEFTVTLLVRRPKVGGMFEYAPNLRSPGNENYDAVSEVLDGNSSRVEKLELQLGDLQLFLGRFSLHRIAPVEDRRLAAIFAFSNEPGHVGSVESTLKVYGRVMREHLEADGQQKRDGLQD